MTLGFYTQSELRKMARDQGHHNWAYLSKSEMCELVGVSRLEDTPKYVLKNLDTDVITHWRSVNKIQTTLKVNSGNIFYALKKGRHLKIGGVKHEIKQVRF